MATEFDLPALAGMTPQHMVRLAIPGTRVMQSFTRDPGTGEFYLAQVSTDTTSNMRVYRLDAAGRVLDYATLQGAGHGSSITAQRVGGTVYLWLWWTQDTTGDGASPVRWAYHGTADGAFVTADDAEAVPDPDAAEPGHLWGEFAIDQATDRLATYFRDGNTERLTLWQLSDYLDGATEPLARATITKPAAASFQGFTTTDTHAYIARGGSSDTDIAPTLYALDWTSGTVTDTLDVSGLALEDGTASGGHNEAEGVCVWRDRNGVPSLLFGIVSGPLQQREADVYELRGTFEGDPRRLLLLDVLDVAGDNLPGRAFVSYDRDVRTSDGIVPAGARRMVELGPGLPGTVSVLASDYAELADASQRFAVKVEVVSSDAEGNGARFTTRARVLMSDNDPVALSAAALEPGVS